MRNGPADETAPDLQPFFTPGQISDMVVSYLNTNALKRQVDLGCIQRVELLHRDFVDLKTQIEVAYTYQPGRVDRRALDMARQRYDLQYQQYQMAMTQWHAADEAAKRGNSHQRSPEGTKAPYPYAPSEPREADYLQWGDNITEMLTHTGQTRLSLSPDAQEWQDAKHVMPTAVAAAGGYAVKAIDPQRIQQLASSVHQSAAQKAVEQALAKYHHRHVSVSIKRDKSSYLGLTLPIWEVDFEDRGRLKKIYVDELNGVISGERIGEGSVWLAMVLKQVGLFIVLMMALALTDLSSGGVALALAFLMQFGGWWALYTLYRANPAPWLGEVLDWFDIRNLAKKSSSDPAQHLDRYLGGLDNGGAWAPYNAQRQASLSQHRAQATFQPWDG